MRMVWYVHATKISTQCRPSLPEPPEPQQLKAAARAAAVAQAAAADEAAVDEAAEVAAGVGVHVAPAAVPLQNDQCGSGGESAVLS